MAAVVRAETADLHARSPHLKVMLLSLGALGIVFGDIGTSPLYSVQTIFSSIDPSEENVIGAISCIFWLLNCLVTFKYVTIIMRANNHGEGGIMALTALASRSSHDLGRPWWKTATMLLGMFGATLFYGDSVITPAMSVMSALEGVSMASDALTGKTMYIALGILIGLFLMQRWGTGVVGRLFGPIMLLWFITLSIVGIEQIIKHPEVLQALNPGRAVTFLDRQRKEGSLLTVLGYVVLSVTGGEALYADMGHFGALPIRIAWCCIVLPGLSLNYLGQGALLLGDPSKSDNPFYNMFPEYAIVPVVVLATFATVIASQAVISGTFSVTSQAMKLGFVPRMEVQHMSKSKEGRVYIPIVNTVLMAAVVAVTAGYGTSAALASAYGMSVTLTMTIDGLLTAFVGTRFCIRQGWTTALVPFWLLMACFATLDGLLVASCAEKFVQGAWFPITVGLVLFIMISTWTRGSELLRAAVRSNQPPLQVFAAWLAEETALSRAPRTAVFTVPDSEVVPQALILSLRHYKVLHEINIILRVNFTEEPRVARDHRLEVEPIAPTFWRVTVSCGFQDHPDMPDIVQQLATGPNPLPLDPSAVSYFVGRSIVTPTQGTGLITSMASMALWRKWLFAAMHRNASSPVDYFGLPHREVVFLSTEVEI